MSNSHQEPAAATGAASVPALYARLYSEIRRIAASRLREVGGVTDLDTSSLVHEGFIKLAEREGLQTDERGQFFAYVGYTLRSVVMDHLRAKATNKRQGMMVTLSHAEETPDGGAMNLDLQAFDDAMTRIKAMDEPLANLIEMHFFAGMTVAELAQVRNVSTRTIERDLKKVRILLTDLLAG